VSRLVPERKVRRWVAGGMLGMVLAAALIFALPFAFPTPPPIITRFKSTVVFSPNDDGRRDAATVLLRVRERSEVTLEVRDGDRLVRGLIVGETLPRGPHTREWDGRDDRGARVPDGTYSLRLRARSGEKLFNVSRTVTVDTERPGITRFEVRSGALQRRQRGRCRLLIEADADAGVLFEVRRAGPPVIRLGPRPLKADVPLRWHWSGEIAGSRVPEGLYRVVTRVTDRAGNSLTRSATCWVGWTSGRTRPARPQRGSRVRALVRDERGRALPATTAARIALYERAATPGRDPGPPLGRRVGGQAAGPLATTSVRLPVRRSPRSLWLVAITNRGTTLIPVGG
jgi:hypothetical protein